MKEVKISTEYIKLGQLLKYIAIIDSGAEAKDFLAENIVKVNEIKEDRRGKKLFDGDIIEVLDNKYVIKA